MRLTKNSALAYMRRQFYE